MKPNKTQFAAVPLWLLTTFLSVVLFTAPYSAAGKVIGWQTSQTVTAQKKKMIAAFNRHVKDYLSQRERVKAKVPPLSKDATPEQIAAHQKSFVEALRAMRAGTKPGYIFNPQVADYLRTIIKTEFPPREKAEIRQTILEADTRGVPLKVNYPYPETKELAQIPPTLLLKLPQLPKEVKYR